MIKEKIYDEKISHLVSEIIKICKSNNISMFSTFVLDYDEEIDDSLLCTTALPASKFDKDNEIIKKLRQVAKEGYDVHPRIIAMTISSGK